MNKKNIIKKSEENTSTLFSSIKRTAAALILILCFAVNLFSVNLSAASVSFSLSGKTVTEGENITVVFSSSVPVAAVDATLQFDPSFLKFVSSSGGFGASPSVNGGTVNIVDYLSSGEDVIYSLSLTFTALKSGSTTVSAGKISVSDGSGDLMDVTGRPSSELTINAKPTASSDNSLKSLSVNPGKLSPAFSSSRTSYTVSVANSVTSVAVSAGTNHSAAKYSVSGNTKLSVGKNTVTVKVTAENGDVKKYVITVNRAAPPAEEKPDPEPPKPIEPEVPKIILKTSDGTEMTPSEFEETQIPAGFTKTEVTVSEQAVDAVTFKNNGSVAIYLKPVSEESALESGFYYYDAVTGSLSPVPVLNSKAGNFTILNITDENAAPEGYKTDIVTVNGKDFKAFVPKEETEIENYILYAVNSNGKDGFYVYDVEEETFQRYGIVAVRTERDEPLPEPPAVEPPKQEETPVYMKILFYGGISLSVLLLIVCIVLIVFYNKISKSYNKLLSAKKRAAIKRREKQQSIFEEEKSVNNNEDSAESLLTENIDDLLTAGEYDVEDDD